MNLCRADLEGNRLRKVADRGISLIAISTNSSFYNELLRERNRLWKLRITHDKIMHNYPENTLKHKQPHYQLMDSLAYLLRMCLYQHSKFRWFYCCNAFYFMSLQHFYNFLNLSFHMQFNITNDKWSCLFNLFIFDDFIA